MSYSFATFVCVFFSLSCNIIVGVSRLYRDIQCKILPYIKMSVIWKLWFHRKHVACVRKAIEIDDILPWYASKAFKLIKQDLDENGEGVWIEMLENWNRYFMCAKVVWCMSHENWLISYTSKIDFFPDRYKGVFAVQIVLIARKNTIELFSFRFRNIEDAFPRSFISRVRFTWDFVFGRLSKFFWKSYSGTKDSFSQKKIRSWYKNGLESKRKLFCFQVVPS